MFARTLFRVCRSFRPLRRPPRGARALATSSALASAAAFTYVAPSEPELPSQPLSLPEVEDASHAFLIRQTCVSVVEAQSLFLTRFVVAAQDLGKEYIEVLSETANLLEESVLALTEAGSERLVELKARGSHLRKQVNDQELMLHYVRKSVDASAELCFLAGAEFASAQVSEKLRAAEVALEALLERVRLLELDVAKAHSAHIDKVGRAKKVLERQTEEELHRQKELEEGLLGDRGDE